MKSDPVTTNDIVSVAVIVPLRNEEWNVEGLLNSISKQRYPHFEIILVDDHSDDATIDIADRWMSVHPEIKLKCISSIGNSKKDAITHAIDQTEAVLIITTDADCRMGKDWVQTVVNHFVYNNSYLISSPVIMRSGYSVLEKIQSAEYAGLSAIGAAAISAHSPMFCSGANLAFPKEIFIEVGGYSGSKSSSGDDTQLMRKISSKWPDKISFLKNFDAAIETHSSVAERSRSIFEQRRRWASKIPFTLSPFTISIAALAWIIHFVLLLQLIMSVANENYSIILISWLIKIFGELLLLKSAIKFQKQKFPFMLVIIVQPLYALYVVVIGAVAPFTKFTWKGRATK